MLRNVPSADRRKWLPPRIVDPVRVASPRRSSREGLGQRREDRTVGLGDVGRAERRGIGMTGEQPGRDELGEHDELGAFCRRLARRPRSGGRRSCSKVASARSSNCTVATRSDVTDGAVRGRGQEQRRTSRPLHLPGVGVAGEPVHAHDLGGGPCSRRATPRSGARSPSGSCTGRRREHDRGDDLLAVVRVGQADDGGLLHVGMRDRTASTSAGDTLTPPRMIRSLSRPDDVHVALLVDLDQVAGAVPAVAA